LSDLFAVFREINAAHFDGFLEPPVLRWNSRLRWSAGRFVPGSRRSLLGHSRPPRIEIATFIQTAPEGRLPGGRSEPGPESEPEIQFGAEAVARAGALTVLEDTMGHEMIHYWLWCRGKPYGHTSQFYAKMREMGVSRFHTLHTPGSPRHVYKCPECAREFRTKRRIVKRDLACRTCCEKHAAGRYHSRFKLVYEGSIEEGCGPASP
jgi:predicted SprT family Zn-dependent metalloprotease